MVGWGTPHRFFRLEPDLTPFIVLALSLAVAFLLLIIVASVARRRRREDRSDGLSA